MKKFSLMMIAAFIAVVSWAAQPVDRQVKQAPMQLSSLNKADARQFVPGQKAPVAQLQAITSNRMTAKAKANVRRAPKKASVTDLLSKQWMLLSDNYTYDAEAQELVEAEPFSDGTLVTFSLIDMQTIGIDGFVNGADQTVKATFSMTVDEELQAQGVVAVVTIAGGQTLIENFQAGETSYGPVALFNATSPEDPITAYVFQQGYVAIQDLWVAQLSEGDYAGYNFTNYCYSIVMPVNGKMSWGEGE